MGAFLLKGGGLSAAVLCFRDRDREGLSVAVLVLHPLVMRHVLLVVEHVLLVMEHALTKKVLFLISPPKTCSPLLI